MQSVFPAARNQGNYNYTCKQLYLDMTLNGLETN